MDPSYEPVGGEGGLQAGGDKVALLKNQIGNSAKRFGGLWKLAFFTCGGCVTAAGIISIITGLMNFYPMFDFVNFVYLTLFGLIMLIIDMPVENIYIKNFKFAIFHYALFMTRFVGRGFWYLFLGAMTVGALWSNDVSPTLGFFLGGYIGAVAVASIVYGMKLSWKLEEVRKQIVAQDPEKWGTFIPPRGMTKGQFKEMAVAVKGLNYKFTDEELSYIVAAFSFEVKADDVISRDEFEEWCRGPGMTVL